MKKNDLDNYTKEELEYINMVNRMPKLSNEELHILLEQGTLFNDKFRKRVIEAHLYLVVPIAKNLVGNGLDFIDLVEEGAIGLIKSIDSFNNGDYKDFIKSINVNVYYSIMNAIRDKGKCVRIPSGSNKDFFSYKKSFDKYVSVFGEYPKEEEMIEITGFSEEQSNNYYKWCFDIISLNELNENEEKFGDTITDENISVEEIVTDKVFDEKKKMVINHVVNNYGFNDKQKYIIINNYGLFGKKRKQYNEIAEFLGISSTRVKQIERHALIKLRKNEQICQLLKDSSYVHEKSKNEEGKKKRYAKNIYDFFHDYPAEDVDEVIKRLTEEELKILHKRYDENYNIIPMGIDITKFYSLSRKMKRMLVAIDIIKDKRDCNEVSNVVVNIDSNKYEYDAQNCFSKMFDNGGDDFKLKRIFKC